jgi:hypothetical protein
VLTSLPPSLLRTGGPGLQESVHHYALRMAAQCCFSLGKLETFLLRNESDGKRAGSAFFPSSWIGPRSNFRALLSALERDTGVKNLHTGTFLSVSDVMGRGGTRRRQIRGDGRVWCPACYLKWDDRSSFEPLIWAFDMLSACPIHGVELESRCRECGAAQSFSVDYRRRRSCKVCASPLGHDGGVIEVDKQALWVNATLLQFTRWIEEVDEPITSEKYIQFLELMRAKGSIDGLPPVIRSYVETVRDKGRRRVSLPTISTLLNLAAFQGVAVQDLLCEPSFAASPHLAQGATRFEGVLFRRRDLQLPHRRIVYVMAKLAESGDPVPPPSVVWGQLGLWCDGVRDYCPVEHHAFREKFRAQRLPVSMSRFKLATAACMRLLTTITDKKDAKELALNNLKAKYCFDDVAADFCLEACRNLAEALDSSSSEEELTKFESRRAAGVARWAADGAAGA